MVIYINKLPLYRRSVFKLLDKSYNCNWFIDANTDSSVKCFDENELKVVNKLHIIKIGPFVWTIGLLKLLKFNTKNYLLAGATRNISLFIFLVIKFCFFHNKKVYLWTHGYYGKETYLIRLYKRLLFKLADGVFLYGNYSKNLMIKDGFKESKLHVIHNSLSYDTQFSLRNTSTHTNIYRDHFNNSYPNIIFVGRLTREKNIQLLLDALSILKSKSEPYNITFIGDGDIYDDLRVKTHLLDLDKNVWFYGASYNEKINAEFLFNADLCVSPGNVGLTAVHSMMFGCPVITHNDFRYQMPEFETIVNGRTGAFFKHDDCYDLANTIHKWFADNQYKREEIRTNCFEVIDSSWNPIFQLNVIKSVIND